MPVMTGRINDPALSHKVIRRLKSMRTILSDSITAVSKGEMTRETLDNELTDLREEISDMLVLIGRSDENRR